MCNQITEAISSRPIHCLCFASYDCFTVCSWNSYVYFTEEHWSFRSWGMAINWTLFSHHSFLKAFMHPRSTVHSFRHHYKIMEVSQPFPQEKSPESHIGRDLITHRKRQLPQTLIMRRAGRVAEILPLKASSLCVGWCIQITYVRR